MTANNGLKSTEKRTSLKQGALLNWLSLGLNFGVSFMLTPIIIHKLGSAGFGMWALIQSFSGYYGLVNLGLASALQRFVSRDLALGDQASLQQTVGTAIGFFAATGSVVLLAAAILHGPAADFFAVPANEAAAFGATLMLCAGAVVADFFGALITTLFTARERFDLSNELNIGRQFVQAGGIYWMLQSYPSIRALAAVVCLVSVAAVVVSWFVVRRLYPQTRLTGKGFDRTRLKELLGYGSSTSLITVSNIIRLRLGNMVIAKTAGMAAVGAFSVASNLVIQMNSIMASSFNVLTPRFTRLHTEDNQRELRRLYRLSLFISSCMACGMGLMMLVFGERFILLWIGENFLPAVPILQVLTIAYVFALAQSPSWNMMFALARHSYMSRVTIAEAAAILVCGLWFSREYGAMGFACATAGAMLFTKLLLHPPYAARIAGLKLTEYLAPMSAPFGVGALLLVLAALLDLPGFLRHNSLFTFIGSAAAFGILYGLLVLSFTWKSEYAPSSVLKLLKRQRSV